MRAFRSFAEEVRIDFPTSGLVLIRGKNQVSHDSSGTGKSTILLAISYALDMCPFPASELQSWHIDADMQVQLGLDTPLGEVIINRGKRNSLKIGDQDSIIGAKAIAEGIRKLFGLDIETLQAITYRPQDTKGLFLSLTDSEKKEFLTRILGLTNIEAAVATSETAIKNLSPAVETERVAIEALEIESKSLQSQVIPENQESGELTMELEYVRGQLGALGVDRQVQAAWDKARLAKDAAVQDPEVLQIQNTLIAARQHYQNVTTVNGEKYRVHQAHQEQLRKKVQDIVRQETQKANTVQTIAGLRTQLQHALDGKCSTCFRTWDQAAKKAEEIQATMANHESLLKTWTVNPDEKRKIDEELRQSFVADPAIEQFRSVIAQLEAQLSDLQAELVSGPLAQAQEVVNGLNIQKASFTARLQGLEREIRSIRDGNERLDQARKVIQTNVKTNEDRLIGRRKVISKLTMDLNAEKDFLALMGRDGFLGVIFEDVLTEIEIEANERLARLANVSHVTIQFKSEVTTQKGTVNKTITPVVSVNGVEARLKSGLSGGMYTSVEGVVDLAVMSVVQRRTGAIPGFLFLDESFNGQGNATKEAAMEVLREYGQEKLVLVIDHNSEFKEMFTQFINVVYKDGKSEIV